MRVEYGWLILYNDPRSGIPFSQTCTLQKSLKATGIALVAKGVTIRHASSSTAVRASARQLSSTSSKMQVTLIFMHSILVATRNFRVD